MARHNLAGWILLGSLLTSGGLCAQPGGWLGEAQSAYRKLAAKTELPEPSLCARWAVALREEVAARPDRRAATFAFLRELDGAVRRYETHVGARLELLTTAAFCVQTDEEVAAFCEAVLEAPRNSFALLLPLRASTFHGLRGEALAIALARVADGLEGSGRGVLASGFLEIADPELVTALGAHRPLAAKLATWAEDDDPLVADAALAAVGLATEPTHRGLLIAGATAERAARRQAAATGLGHALPDPLAGALLVRLLKDPAAQVRERAAAALGRAADLGVAGLLIERLAVEPLRLRVVLARSLRQLTGQGFGPEFGPWNAWRRREAALAEGEEPPTPYATPTGALPRYRGLDLASDRVVFVLDVSGSMGWSVGASSKEPTRIERAKEALEAVIEALDERTQFGMVFYAQEIAHWKPGLVAATARNKALARRFVRAQGARGGTDTHGALHEAFRVYPDADTIVLSSDGVPSYGAEIATMRIVAEVLRWNRDRGVRVDTIATVAGEMLNPFRRNREDPDAAALFLRLLARATGGRFVNTRDL